MVEKHRLTLLNDDERQLTFYPDNLQNQSSVLDLTWATAHLEPLIKSCCVKNLFRLDHQPLLITLTRFPPPTDLKRYPNYRKAKWESIETTIKDDQTFETVSTLLQTQDLSIETIYETTQTVTRRIQEVLRRHISVSTNCRGGGTLAFKN